MFLKNKVRQLTRWFNSKQSGESQRSEGVASPRACDGRSKRTVLRKHMVESMEKRNLMTADPIWVGGVYVESDIGSDLHGDLFYVTFRGGAPGTQLTRLTISGDLNTPGFGLGDLFFDTVDGGYGADHSFAFQIEELRTANSNASFVQRFKMAVRN